MRKKRFLAAILLGVILCFVSSVGYGEIETPEEFIAGEFIVRIDFLLQKARIDYMMDNPSDFLGVNSFYDVLGDRAADFFPENVDTVSKVGIVIFDNRGLFFNETGRVLLKQFEKQLEIIYLFIRLITTDMNNDVIAEFVNKQGRTIGYFYEGEYHLWEE